MGFNNQGHTLFCTNPQTNLDRFFDIYQYFLQKLYLVDAAKDRWLLFNSDIVFITIDANDQFHFELLVLISGYYANIVIKIILLFILGCFTSEIYSRSIKLKVTDFQLSRIHREIQILPGSGLILTSIHYSHLSQPRIIMNKWNLLSQISEL